MQDPPRLRSRGLLNIKNCGSITVAQDEARWVVFGMPGESIQLAVAENILKLAEIGRDLIGLAQFHKAS